MARPRLLGAAETRQLNDSVGLTEDLLWQEFASIIPGARPAVSVAPALQLDGDSLAAAGAAVPTWTDTVAARSFTQANAGLQPLVVAAPNSHRAAKFDGDALISDLASTARPAMTITMVMRVDAITTIPRTGLLAGVTSSTSDDYNSSGNWALETPFSTSETAFSSMLVGGAPTNSDSRIKSTSQPVGEWVIVTVVIGSDAGPIRAYSNGASESLANFNSSDNPDLTFNRLVLGARHYNSGPADYSKFSLAHLRVYPGRLSDTDRALVHSELSDRYAITVTDYVAPTVITNPGTDRTLPTGLLCLFRADTIGVADGANVTAWTDSVGGRAAFTRNQPPTKVAAGVAQGQPAVRFNGTNQSLGVSSPPTVPQPYTVVAVVRSAVTTGSSDRQITWQGSGGELGISSSGRWFGFAGATRTGSLVSTNPTVVTNDYDGSNGSMFVNGALVVSANLGTGNMDQGIMLIGENLYGPNFWSGDIYEIRIYDHILTAAERAQLHSYAQDRYGITVTDYVPNTTTPPVVTPPAAGTRIDIDNLSGIVQRLRGDSSPTTTVGAGVSLWDDRTANNRDATQANARPTYISSPKPGAAWNSTGQYLSTAAPSQSVETFTCVVRSRATSGYHSIRGSSTSGGSGATVVAFNNGYPVISRQGVADTVSSPTIAPTDVMLIMTFEVSAAQARIWMNGTLLASVNNPAVPVAGQTTTIGAGYNFSDNWVGDIFETITVGRVLTDTERNQIHSDLADYYGVTTSDYVPLVTYNPSQFMFFFG